MKSPNVVEAARNGSRSGSLFASTGVGTVTIKIPQPNNTLGSAETYRLLF